jgi:DNA-binding CsgD family transcriptional regulator
MSRRKLHEEETDEPAPSERVVSRAAAWRAQIQDLQRRIRTARLHYQIWEAIMAKRISEGSEASALEYEAHRLLDGETPELRDLRAKLEAVLGLPDPRPSPEELRSRRELRDLARETKVIRKARRSAKVLKARLALAREFAARREAERIARLEAAKAEIERRALNVETQQLLPRFEAMLPPIEPLPHETPGDAYDRVEVRASLLRAIASSATPRELPAVLQVVALGETLREVGAENGVTKERIRHHGRNALRKLRHPSRSGRLKVFDEPAQGPVALGREPETGFHLWERDWEESAWTLPSAEEVLGTAKVTPNVAAKRKGGAPAG